MGMLAEPAYLEVVLAATKVLFAAADQDVDGRIDLAEFARPARMTFSASAPSRGGTGLLTSNFLLVGDTGIEPVPLPCQSWTVGALPMHNKAFPLANRQFLVRATSSSAFLLVAVYTRSTNDLLSPPTSRGTTMRWVIQHHLHQGSPTRRSTPHTSSSTASMAAWSASSPLDPISISLHAAAPCSPHRKPRG
nr:hypothetical protein [Kibdelosporangium sp. MJ126-NF4]